MAKETTELYRAALSRQKGGNHNSLLFILLYIPSDDECEINLAGFSRGSISCYSGYMHRVSSTLFCVFVFGNCLGGEVLPFLSNILLRHF